MNPVAVLRRAASEKLSPWRSFSKEGVGPCWPGGCVVDVSTAMVSIVSMTGSFLADRPASQLSISRGTVRART